MKILIVEDETDLLNSITDYLSGENYLCENAKDFIEASNKIATYNYDCILLDLMLPHGDGLSLLKLLKEQKRADGVIIISAKNALDDKITGLQLGADDYLAKPFHLAELGARIHSVLRRKHFDNSNQIEFGDLQVDLLSKSVFVHHSEITLTKKEFDLLLFFLGNKNKVVSKSALAEHLSGDLADMFDNHDFVYAHVKNLKKKLSDAGCENYIKTKYGTGYKWSNE